MDRWEWLEGIKLETAATVAVKHLAKMVADELLAWPPRVDVTDKSFATRFAAILEPSAERPSPNAFEEALRCVRWELGREYDAMAFYGRNDGRAKACPDAVDRLASEFIQHYVLEAFFVLMEKTNYRVKRKDALAGIDWVERRIAAAGRQLD